MARKRRGRTEGSIFYREADRRWVASISLGYDGEGRRVRRVVYGATKGEVQEKLRRLQTEAVSGLLAEAGRLTVGEYLQRWLDNTAKARVRPTTFARYEQLIRLHLKPILGGVRLGKLGAIHVEALYAEMERRDASAWTRRMAGVLLTNALRQAVRLKLIPFNPAADIAKARPNDREMKFLTESQARRFLEAARGHRLYALFALAVGSGMRQGELLGLAWGDIDFDKGTVSVRRSLAQLKGQPTLKEPKSARSRRTIQLPRFVLDALHDHRKAMVAEGHAASPVFCTRTGTYYGKSNLIRQAFKPTLNRANERAALAAKDKGIEPEALPDIRFHDLRHTHATTLLARGHSLKAVSHRLGHASVELTLRVYAHVLPTDDGVLAESLERMYG
jgi:integrase